MNAKTEDQKPRTAEQIAALPVGGGFGIETHDLTDEDRKRGYVEIRRHQLTVSEGAKQLKFRVAPDVVAFFNAESDVNGYIDEDGVEWRLGRYADGRWFRHRC